MLRAGAQVALRVPGSSANLGPGFDCVGLALGVWDEASAEVLDRPGLVVEVAGEGAQDVPRDEHHLVVRAMRAMWRHLDVPVPEGLRLSSTNGVPHGRGLGSSAAAIVMGAALAHALAVRSALTTAPDGQPCDLDVVNTVASGLEGHPDNASASVFGGATLSVTEPAPFVHGEPHAYPRTTTVPLRLHTGITPIVCVPETTLSTTTARAVLPPSVSLETAAANTSRGAVLVHALTTDPDLLLAGTTDLLHQEARRPSYPATMALVDALRAAGHAATVSGAGPSVLVLATLGEDSQAQVAELAGPGWRTLAPGVPSCGVTLVG